MGFFLSRLLTVDAFCLLRLTLISSWMVTVAGFLWLWRTEGFSWEQRLEVAPHNVTSRVSSRCSSQVAVRRQVHHHPLPFSICTSIAPAVSVTLPLALSLVLLDEALREQPLALPDVPLAPLAPWQRFPAGTHQHGVATPARPVPGFWLPVSLGLDRLLEVQRRRLLLVLLGPEVLTISLSLERLPFSTVIGAGSRP